jgi:predicted secreted protein
MNEYAILALTAVLSTVASVSATGICDNAPCEKAINVSLDKEFNISLDDNGGSTGFQWWTNYNTSYLSLVNSTFVLENALSGMVGQPGKRIFTFKAIKPGNTEVILLLLRPWENGTIAERKIFPVNIEPVSAHEICNYAPCQEEINVSRDEEFNISLDSNAASTGFEWWANYDPSYLRLIDSVFVYGAAPSGLVGQPGKRIFTLNAIKPGDTEVILLLLRPWENGTIAERKIFPVKIE